MEQPESVDERSGIETKGLKNRRKTPHERDLERNELARLVVETEKMRLVNAKLVEDTRTIAHRNAILEQEASRLWWDKYLRIAATLVIFQVVIFWLWSVLQVLREQGISSDTGPSPNRLGDSVLIALLGTTTVNVLGLLFIVARYLFPQPTKPREDRTATS